MCKTYCSLVFVKWAVQSSPAPLGLAVSHGKAILPQSIFTDRIHGLLEFRTQLVGDFPCVAKEQLLTLSLTNTGLKNKGQSMQLFLHYTGVDQHCMYLETQLTVTSPKHLLTLHMLRHPPGAQNPALHILAFMQWLDLPIVGMVVATSGFKRYSMVVFPAAFKPIEHAHAKRTNAKCLQSWSDTQRYCLLCMRHAN